MGASVDFEALNSMLESAESVAEQLVLGLEDDGPDSGTGLAPCVGAARAARIGAEHMEQVVQELEQHFELPLVFEVVCTAGIGHTVDTAECRGCSQGNAAGNTVRTGAAAGTAQLFEFGEQLLDLEQQ